MYKQILKLINHLLNILQSIFIYPAHNKTYRQTSRGKLLKKNHNYKDGYMKQKQIKDTNKKINK